MQVATDYRQFIHNKSQVGAGDGFEPVWLPDFLFGFQQQLAGWAVRIGRGALYVDCGGGKTPMSLVWGQNVYKHTADLGRRRCSWCGLRTSIGTQISQSSF